MFELEALYLHLLYYSVFCVFQRFTFPAKFSLLYLQHQQRGNFDNKQRFIDTTFLGQSVSRKLRPLQQEIEPDYHFYLYLAFSLYCSLDALIVCLTCCCSGAQQFTWRERFVVLSTWRLSAVSLPGRPLARSLAGFLDSQLSAKLRFSI